jgi:hypothetical protein
VAVAVAAVELADHGAVGDGLVVLAAGAGQHDPRAQRQCLGRLGPPRPSGQLVTLGVRQDQPGLRPKNFRRTTLAAQ